MTRRISSGAGRSCLLLLYYSRDIIPKVKSAGLTRMYLDSGERSDAAAVFDVHVSSELFVWRPCYDVPSRRLQSEDHTKDHWVT